jgi:hypothetical protein
MMPCSTSAASTGGGPALPHSSSARRRVRTAARMPWPPAARSMRPCRRSGRRSGSCSRFSRYRSMRDFSIVSMSCRSPGLQRMARSSWKQNAAAWCSSATAVRPPSSMSIRPPKTKFTVTLSIGGEQPISTAGPYTEDSRPSPFSDRYCTRARNGLSRSRTVMRWEHPRNSWVRARASSTSSVRIDRGSGRLMSAGTGSSPIATSSRPPNPPERLMQHRMPHDRQSRCGK